MMWAGLPVRTGSSGGTVPGPQAATANLNLIGLVIQYYNPTTLWLKLLLEWRACTIAHFTISSVLL